MIPLAAGSLSPPQPVADAPNPRIRALPNLDAHQLAKATLEVGIARVTLSV
jgi:hypothetical protein